MRQRLFTFLFSVTLIPVFSQEPTRQLTLLGINLSVPVNWIEAPLDPESLNCKSFFTSNHGLFVIEHYKNFTNPREFNLVNKRNWEKSGAEVKTQESFLGEIPSIKIEIKKVANNHTIIVRGHIFSVGKTTVFMYYRHTADCISLIERECEEVFDSVKGEP